MSNSKLTPYQDECLTILMEECGEVIQEICKIMRFGMMADSYHHPGSSHLDCLETEMGDLLGCIELVKNAKLGISSEKLELAKQNKLIKVKKWMVHAPDKQETSDRSTKTLQLAQSQLNNYKRV